MGRSQRAHGRSNAGMSRAGSVLLVLAGSLGILGLIAATCYVTMEVWGLRDGTADLVIGGLLTVTLVPAFVWLLRRQWPGGGKPATAIDLEAIARERQRRIDARIVQLRGDAARERWIPLVTAGHWLDDDTLARWNARLAELQAVPHRRRYGEDLLRGIEYSDAQIDYLESPEQLITCEHLRGVERALKAAGQRPLPIAPRRVAVGCQLAFAALRERFQLPVGVEAIDVMVNPRDDEYDHRLHCSACGSDIVGQAHGVHWPG